VIGRILDTAVPFVPIAERDEEGSAAPRQDGVQSLLENSTLHAHDVRNRGQSGSPRT
jgi:hypothetical protein